MLFVLIRRLQGSQHYFLSGEVRPSGALATHWPVLIVALTHVIAKNINIFLFARVVNSTGLVVLGRRNVDFVQILFLK